MKHREQLSRVAKMRSMRQLIQPDDWHTVPRMEHQKWHIIFGTELRTQQFIWLTVHEVLRPQWLMEQKILLLMQQKKLAKHGKVY